MDELRSLRKRSNDRNECYESKLTCGFKIACCEDEPIPRSRVRHGSRFSVNQLIDGGVRER
eukprot:scaffold1437_cov268-Pinguiococcus_pyrenoidosus.AAC.14